MDENNLPYISGLEAFEEGDYRSAIDRFDEHYQSLKYKNREALRYLGISCEMMGDQSKANDYFIELKKATATFETDWRIFVSEKYLEMKRYTEALKYINLFLDTKPNKEKYSYLLAQTKLINAKILRQMNNNQQAIKEYEKANSLCGTDEGYLELLELYYCEKEYEKGLKTSISVNVDYDLMADLYYYQAKFYAVLGQCNDALDSINKAIDLNSDNLDFCILRIEINTKLGNIDSALTEYNHLKKNKGDDPRIKKIEKLVSSKETSRIEKSKLLLKIINNVDYRAFLIALVAFEKEIELEKYDGESYGLLKELCDRVIENDLITSLLHETISETYDELIYEKENEDDYEAITSNSRKI